MNYYQRHLGDYASAAGHLTALEHGIYNLLIDWYYANEQPIPDAHAHRIARVSREEVAPILSEFFQQVGETWEHKRIDREIAAYHEKSDKAKASAMQSWANRGNGPKRSHSDGIATAKRSHSDGNANHKPITNNQEPIKNNGDEYTADFLSFWDSWPDGYGSKGAKAGAFREWRKARSLPSAEFLIAAANAQADDKTARKMAGEFVENFKHVCRWLKGREWENEAPMLRVVSGEVYR